MTHRPRLPGFATTGNIDHDVEAFGLLDQFQRLPDNHAPRYPGEKLVNRFTVDHDAARTTLHEHTGDGTLATPRTVK